MDLNSATEMVDILQSEGYEAELYYDYSGRGMYGNTTTGVTTDARPNTMAEMEALEEWDFRSDSMGLDYIYY